MNNPLTLNFEPGTIVLERRDDEVYIPARIIRKVTTPILGFHWYYIEELETKRHTHAPSYTLFLVEEEEQVILALRYL